MRTTPWTTEQKTALDKLTDDGRIENERPCGCFDVRITGTFIVLVPCDSCKTMLTNMGVISTGEEI
jgi:hypothetical protein